MAGAFLYQNVIGPGCSFANFVASPPGMPLENLLDPQPRIRARMPGNSLGLVIDLGTAQPIDCVALLSTNLTGEGTLGRVLLSTVDATGVAGDAWNSGQFAAVSPADANGQLVVVNPAGPATGRYLRINLASVANNPIDIGLIVAGPLWRLARSHAWGIAEGRQVLDRRDRNPFTGAEFPVAAVANPRSAKFTLPYLSSAEARGEHRALVARLGAAGDALWIPDLALSAAEMNLRSLWGAVATPGELAGAVQQRANLFQRSFTITERL